MDMSEIMIIIILFDTSYQHDFKRFYTGYLARFFKSDFAHLLLYGRFLELIPRTIVPLCSYFCTIRSQPTGIEFIDRTSINVCHNLRTPRLKTLSGLASRGKGTMGWFCGFKLYLIVNHKGGIVAAKITSANMHDTQSVSEMVVELYADKGYISKALASDLLEQGITLVNNVREK
jgi:hypothetical protein